MTALSSRVKVPIKNKHREAGYRVLLNEQQPILRKLNCGIENRDFALTISVRVKPVIRLEAGSSSPSRNDAI